MDNFNQALLEKDLIVDEGLRFSPYDDTRGIPTVGIGHNLRASPLSGVSYPLTQAQVDAIFNRDIAKTLASLDARLPWWSTKPEPVARCIANMAFNMGVGTSGPPATGLMQFTNTLHLLQTDQFKAAADALDHSLWDRQVHGRADRIEAILRAA